MHNQQQSQSDAGCSDESSEFPILNREKTTKTSREISKKGVTLFSLKIPHRSHDGFKWVTFEAIDDEVYCVESNGGYYVGPIEDVTNSILDVADNWKNYDVVWVEDREFVKEISKLDNARVNVKRNAQNSFEDPEGDDKSDGSGGGVSSTGTSKFNKSRPRTQRTGRAYQSKGRFRSSKAGSSEVYDDIDEPIHEDLK